MRDRVAVRIEEAAELLGLSERAFRDHILSRSDCPRFYAGRAVRIPLRPFVAFIERLALEDAGASDPTATELLDSVSDIRID